MKARILVVGDAMADVYVESQVQRISPEAPVPVVRESGERRICPGGAVNVAANAASLGAEVAVVGALGRDAEGESVRRQLVEGGVEVSGLVAVDGLSTIRKIRFIARNQQIVRVDQERGEAHYRRAEEALVRALETALADGGPRLVLLSDYGKGTVADGVCDLLRRRTAEDPGLRVLVDPWGRSLDRYAGFWGLKANRAEVEALLGRELPPAALEGGARELLERGFRAVWITLGAQGSYVAAAGEEPYVLASHARSVYDVTGAGDTFLAALGVALGEGSDLREATGFANVSSGLAVESAGTTRVRRLDVDHQQRGGDWTQRWLDVDQAVDVVRRCRAENRRVGFTNGCFDLLHSGHLDSLEWAAERVDVLIVGLNGDDSVRRAKGDDRPILGCRERGRMLLALRCVDYVVPFEEDTPEGLIARLLPDVLFKGEEWSHYVAGREVVEAAGGRVELIPRTPGRSTTGVIRRIRETAPASPGPR